jgi:hypothetical protein
MAPEQHSAESAFPTMEFVARLNASPARAGMPRLTISHPLAMLLWHFEQEALRIRPSDMIKLTGC